MLNGATHCMRYSVVSSVFVLNTDIAHQSFTFVYLQPVSTVQSTAQPKMIQARVFAACYKLNQTRCDTALQVPQSTQLLAYG